MARPLKSGLDYFPLDVYFDDTVELIEAEFGLEGFAILIKLWQKIYANGYYLEWNKDAELLFSKKINSDLNKVNSVINSCLLRNLFNKTMFEQYGILTSSGIQKRYLTACVSSKRKNIVFEERFYLLNDEQKQLITEFIPLTTEETRLTQEESTQRKGKERKGKEIYIPYESVINYLNEKAGANYRHNTNKTRDLIKARFNEGFKEDDFKAVIEKKCFQWKGTDFEKYLRPETLFGNKFDGYLNEKVNMPQQQAKKKLEIMP